MSAIDLDALEATMGPPIGLLAREQIDDDHKTDAGAILTGFSAVERLHVACHVAQAEGVPSIVLLVEESNDGMSWDTAATFTFTDLLHDQRATAVIVGPKDRLKASWIVTGDVLGAITASVTVRPGVVTRS